MDPSFIHFLNNFFVHFYLLLLFIFITAGGVFGVRHLQTFLLFLGLTLAYAMRVNLSVAIVAITDKHAANAAFEVCLYFLLFSITFF